MPHVLVPCSGEVCGPHHRWRQRVKYGLLEIGYRLKTRMLPCACLKVYSSPPCFAQGIGRRTNHAGQLLDSVEFPESRVRQHPTNCFPKRIVVHRTYQAPREPHSELLEGHQLEGHVDVHAPL